MNDYLTTRELAELLRLKERKVYDLASSGKIPCSRATGKLLFPRIAIESWIKDHASGVDKPGLVMRPNVVLGSHDPLLEWAIRESRCGLASCLDSSIDGLQRFAAGDGIATGMHIYDVETDDWNQSMVKARFTNQAVVLVRWAKRQRGIIVDRQRQLAKLDDICGLKLVPRQSEAGSQILLNSLLARSNIKTDEINWLTPALSEVDAVLAVQESKADATFGLSSLAAQYKLGFLPVIEEQFDLLVDRRAWFEPAWQTLLTFCHSTKFSNRVVELVGYDVRESLTVRFNG